MDYDGQHLIEHVVARLEKKKIRCYDAAIVSEIAGLSHHELTEILTKEAMKRYNYKREGKAEGIYVHAYSPEDAFYKAQKISKYMPPAKITFVDNKPCSKNNSCDCCRKILWD